MSKSLRGSIKEMPFLEPTLKKTLVSTLRTELTLGLTLTAIASDVQNAMERERIRNSARLSYETAVRRMHTVHRFVADDIHSQLALLRVALEQLGETF